MRFFELARCPHVSNDHDIHNERRGYKGISIPKMIESPPTRGGMLEMDEPEHRIYRTALNPYLSPAAVKRWVPFVDEVVRACLDDKVEGGHIDFVDDLANVVPAVLTLAMLGIPLANWTSYSEPAHASVYTPPHSPEVSRVAELYMAMGLDMYKNLNEIRDKPRPGIVDALTRVRVDGQAPDDMELPGMLNLLIGGGFDTTTALTAHAFEWLSQHPEERDRLSRERDTLLDSATEEFLRYFKPAPVTHARSPKTVRSPARTSRRASGCGCPGPWPTTIPRCLATRTESYSSAEQMGISVSAWAFTAASVPMSHARCSNRRSLPCWTGFRTTGAIPNARCTTRRSV